MTVHAFIDESQRGTHYLVCVATVAPQELASARKLLRTLRMPNQRELHFKKEKDQRRRMLADRIAMLPVAVAVYRAECCRHDQEAARQRCLSQVFKQLLVTDAHRVVIDSREHRDTNDAATAQRVLGNHPSRTGLTYEHMDSTDEPLLWVADVVGWCYGAGSDWRRRVWPIISEIVEV